MKPWEMGYYDIGATLSQKGTRISVWAPYAKSVSLLYKEHSALLVSDEYSTWSGTLSDLKEGDMYWILVDDKIRLPDPASRYQPEGIFGPSMVVSQRHSVSGSRGVDMDLRETVIYELHVGTFTPGGTFTSMIDKLEYLSNLGITAVELMPISQFEGSRNWGYDGVFPYAVQNTYGRPEEFSRLIDSIHSFGMSAILDVVYNHLGPRGNVLPKFGPYFSTKYRNPWGQCLNFDGEYSDYVRSFFISNAIYWMDQYGVDALRLDAIHGIIDNSPVHFLKELSQRVEEHFRGTGRNPLLIAESDLNDSRIINSRAKCGFGIDAQWCDDFHHSIHSFLTKEQKGYYRDYGDLEKIVKAFRDGFVYTGDYSPFLRKLRGSNNRDYRNNQLIVFSQNHDQVGNRPASDRFSQYMDEDSLRIMVTTVVLSPFVPMIFMGEEFKSDSPFYFFIDTTDEEFASLVRKGRKEEFEYFERSTVIPDPSKEEAFSISKLKWQQVEENPESLEFYRNVLGIRKKYRIGAAVSTTVSTLGDVVLLSYLLVDGGNLTCIYNFGEERNITVSEENPTFILKNGSELNEKEHKLTLKQKGFAIAETNNPLLAQ